MSVPSYAHVSLPGCAFTENESRAAFDVRLSCPPAPLHTACHMFSLPSPEISPDI